MDTLSELPKLIDWNENTRLAQKEIGNIAISEYKHIIPSQFFCVQCGKTHYKFESQFKHYYNTYCHMWSKSTDLKRKDV